MKLTMLKVVSTAAMMATIALTGCSAKRTGTSEVVVAPMGVPGGVGYYNGGAVVTNSTSVITAAGANPNAVYFGFDSSEIDAQGQAVLNQQAQFLQANPSARVAIAGHTDERGSREYNMSLGERRAAAVRSYLLGKGVNQANVEIVSFGEERPVATGSGEEAWSQNRRAELSY